MTAKGVYTSFGFAKYLRDSFPNATYCGFTGTPIDETIAVFGEVVDSYTMKESSVAANSPHLIATLGKSYTL
jgi:type I restriction enzyme R subunit